LPDADKRKGPDRSGPSTAAYQAGLFIGTTPFRATSKLGSPIEVGNPMRLSTEDASVPFTRSIIRTDERLLILSLCTRCEKGVVVQFEFPQV
jgi:hypothetical protein